MINQKEKDLLALLRGNARMSVTELAKQLNVSRTTVQNRLSKLEQSGIVKGYSVKLGERYLAEQVKAHVLVKVSQQLTQTLYSALNKIAAISQLHAISGEYDLIAVVEAEHLAALNQTLDRIGNISGVVRTNSSVILETKFSR